MWTTKNNHAEISKAKGWVNCRESLHRKRGPRELLNNAFRWSKMKRAVLQSCYLYRYGNYANHRHSEPGAGEQGEILDTFSVWLVWMRKALQSRSEATSVDKGVCVLASECGRHWKSDRIRMELCRSAAAWKNWRWQMCQRSASRQVYPQHCHERFRGPCGGTSFMLVLILKYYQGTSRLLTVASI